MNKLNEQLNTGLLIEDRPTDFVLGSTSPIVHESRNLTRDWRLFRSRPERQRFARMDAMNCVSQYSTNQWEEQANWMLANNLWPEDALKFWNKHKYIVEGKFEISERFSAKMSNTTQAGNYFQNVLSSIKNDGVVPEWMWPASLDPNADLFEWDTYYLNPSEELKLLGKESLKYFSMLYERIDMGTQKNKLEIIKKALEHAPLGLAVATCPPWESALVPVCYANPNHAVCNDCIGKFYSFFIYDSYEPFAKELAAGYQIYSIYKAVLYTVKRNEPVVKEAPELLNQDLSFSEMGPEVLKLRSALSKMGWKNNFLWDVYDSELASVVFKFQLANISHVFLEMLLSLKGRRVGPRTREVINKFLTK